MKNFITLKKMISAMVFVLAVYPVASLATTGERNAVDYSQRESWCNLPNIISKDVDTFYIYSTSYVESSFQEGAPDYATLDNPEMVKLAQIECLVHGSVFEDSTNVFAPYYRQAGMRYAGEVAAKTGDINSVLSGMPYDDITGALDYYFENYNEGRPFIIAGHSQGSSMVLLLLEKYFKEHKEYYKRMVAAYPIGYSVTREYLAANPHLKFAKGESDTGVIISWNTEGKKNVEENAKNAVVLPNAISINPLNWLLDETYASSSQNLGSIVEDKKTSMGKIGDVGADAQINLARGVVVTNAKVAPVSMTDYFGPASFHDSDYSLYYMNIKDNVKKRIATYLRSKN